MTTLRVASPAKINLFLHVTGKRADGYHELFSLMVPVGIMDILCISLNQCQGIQVHCDYPGVPSDETNLASQAALLLLERYRKKQGQCPLKGMNIHIDKQIPPGSGLGGGSSNAASVILALNKYFSFMFSMDELVDMAMALGSDVPFFLYESAAVITGAGENVRKISYLPNLYLLVCHPHIPASTSTVFKNYDFCLTQGNKYYTITDPISWMDSWRDPFEFSKGEGLCNDLEDAAFRSYPEIKTVRDEIRNTLQKKVFMSGSGSCLFLLYPSYEEAADDYKKLKIVLDGKKISLFLTAFLN